jgi:hypothetical protein
MRNFFVHLSFLTALGLSIATHVRSSVVSSNPLSFTQEACSLPAPNNFKCTATTPTSANFVWDHVNGAGTYTLKTYISSTFTLVNTTIVPGDITEVEIPNLDAGIEYVTQISSNCENGQQGEGYSSISFLTFILDLVVNSYSIPGGENSGCQLNVPQGNQCSFPWNGDLAKFRVSKGNQGVNFTVQKSPIDGITVTVGMLSNSNFQFLGISQPPAQPCQINTSCTGLSKIRINGSVGQPMDLVTELLFSNTSELGKIYVNGGIKQGYSIQQLREAPSEPRGSGDTANPTVRKYENPTESSEKINIIAVNPFSDQIQITLDSDAKDPVSLQLFDFQGRALHQNEYPAGEEQYTMQAMDVPPGLYLLRVKIGTQISHLKLVKGQ